MVNVNGSDFKLLDRDWDAWAIFHDNANEGTGEAGDQDTDTRSIPFEQVNRARVRRREYAPGYV